MRSHRLFPFSACVGIGIALGSVSAARASIVTTQTATTITQTSTFSFPSTTIQMGNNLISAGTFASFNSALGTLTAVSDSLSASFVGQGVSPTNRLQYQGLYPFNMFGVFTPVGTQTFTAPSITISATASAIPTDVQLFATQASVPLQFILFNVDTPGVAVSSDALQQDVLTYTFTPATTAVPEPASIALLAAGLGALVLRRRR